MQTLRQQFAVGLGETRGRIRDEEVFAKWPEQMLLVVDRQPLLPRAASVAEPSFDFRLAHVCAIRSGVLYVPPSWSDADDAASDIRGEQRLKFSKRPSFTPRGADDHVDLRPTSQYIFKERQIAKNPLGVVVHLGMEHAVKVKKQNHGESYC